MAKWHLMFANGGLYRSTPYAPQPTDAAFAAKDTDTRKVGFHLGGRAAAGTGQNRDERGDA
jgi:hypothetical protein